MQSAPPAHAASKNEQIHCSAVPSISVALFSYNRGTFLANAVASVERCLPDAALTIFDDGSDDALTRATLAEFARRHTVRNMPGDGSSRHGGLYRNMQVALTEAPDAVPLLLMQDDVQLVRALDNADYDAIQRYFDATPKAGFLSPTFIAAPDMDRPPDALHHDAARGVYFPRERGHSAGAYYSDVVLCMPHRLKAIGWEFSDRESHNEVQARKHFHAMGILFVPFAAWLPQVPIYRGRRMTLALRLAEVLSGSGFHPLRLLDAASVSSLRQRKPGQFPYAEDCLLPEDGPLPLPWRYNALQGRGLLKLLHRAEAGLRTLLRATLLRRRAA